VKLKRAGALGWVAGPVFVVAASVATGRLGDAGGAGRYGRETAALFTATSLLAGFGLGAALSLLQPDARTARVNFSMKRSLVVCVICAAPAFTQLVAAAAFPVPSTGMSYKFHALWTASWIVASGVGVFVGYCISRGSLYRRLARYGRLKQAARACAMLTPLGLAGTSALQWQYHTDDHALILGAIYLALMCGIAGGHLYTRRVY
jgi:hypothetical protein